MNPPPWGANQHRYPNACPGSSWTGLDASQHRWAAGQHRWITRPDAWLTHSHHPFSRPLTGPTHPWNRSALPWKTSAHFLSSYRQLWNGSDSALPWKTTPHFLSSCRQLALQDLPSFPVSICLPQHVPSSQGYRCSPRVAYSIVRQCLWPSRSFSGARTGPPSDRKRLRLQRTQQCNAR